MTLTASGPPRTAALPRATAMRMAATEYQRLVDMLRSLSPGDWAKPTDCPGWDVRSMAAHSLGMAEMAASIREGGRQTKLARRADGVFLDALTKLQVDERAGMTPAQIVDRFAARAAKAVRGRRRTPGFIRRRTLPIPQQVGGRDESWTIGYLIDVILTRDPWMHRVDISRATGAPLELSADHDAVLVADVVGEWAARHGQPYRLRLAGPAGGEWANDQAAPLLEMDAVEFCRAVSGRGPADGLLTTQIPF